MVQCLSHVRYVGKIGGGILTQHTLHVFPFFVLEEL